MREAGVDRVPHETLAFSAPVSPLTFGRRLGTDPSPFGQLGGGAGAPRPGWRCRAAPEHAEPAGMWVAAYVTRAPRQQTHVTAPVISAVGGKRIALASRRQAATFTAARGDQEARRAHQGWIPSMFTVLTTTSVPSVVASSPPIGRSQIGSPQPLGQLAVAGHQVRRFAARVERRVDRARGRDDGGDGDQLEPRGAEERLGGGRQRVIPVGGDLRRGEVSHGDERDEHVEADHAADRDQVRARQRAVGVARILGGVGDQLRHPSTRGRSAFRRRRSRCHRRVFRR